VVQRGRRGWFAIEGGGGEVEVGGEDEGSAGSRGQGEEEEGRQVACSPYRAKGVHCKVRIPSRINKLPIFIDI
jgi:hypothetical protein